jgi:hypothetical protein
LHLSVGATTSNPQHNMQLSNLDAFVFHILYFLAILEIKDDGGGWKAPKCQFWQDLSLTF